MRSLESRLLALEATVSSSMVCAGCREAGNSSICHHFGLFLSLVPRVEFESTEEWLSVRKAGTKALEDYAAGHGHD